MGKKALKDLTNKVFSDLQVVGPSNKRGPRGESFWWCQCACGELTNVNSRRLESGKTKSCGCRLKEIRRRFSQERKKYNGTFDTRTYRSWHRMKKRCFDKKDKDYPKYGGKGITVCARWIEYENFVEDMGFRPQGKTLDRINNDGNYDPVNCRWATARQQVLNRPYGKGYQKKLNGNFEVCIKNFGKHRWIGSYHTAEEAYEAYLEAKSKYHKE